MPLPSLSVHKEEKVAGFFIKLMLAGCSSFFLQVIVKAHGGKVPASLPLLSACRHRKLGEG